MSGVTAYFDLDGTLLDASSEKTLTAHIAKKRPWRIPWGTLMWSLGLVGNLLRARSFYDAARNRGHLSLCNWKYLESYSKHLVETKLGKMVPLEALERLNWHREQGHRLVLITATVKPMAIAMADYLGMDAVYGCGPKNMKGILTGSEIGWDLPRRKGKVPIIEQDAKEIGHDLESCWGYGNTYADSFFMSIVGNPVAVNAKGKFKRLAETQNWQQFTWVIE